MTMPSRPTSRSTGFYAPELDGLRWFAVLAVMFAHYSPTLSRYAEWGSPGVRLFYVLSGFLITHILLRARAKCEAGIQRHGVALSEFLIRRVFRLWPLYFASLAVAYAFCVNGTETSFAWHGLFATNHYVYHYQHWPALLSHYWTLAVEQQFYVLWPPALLWLPMRVLRWLLFAMIPVGVLARWLPLATGAASPEYAGVLLPACLDFFALGSMVAWLRRSDQINRIGTRAGLRVAIVGTIAWLLLGAALKTMNRLPHYWCVYDALIQGVGFTFLLVYFLRFSDSWAAAVIRWRPFVYLGQISYGLYIWHNLIHRFGPTLLRRITGESYFASEPAHVAYYVVLTIITAALSYHLLEAPLRHLGQKIAAGVSGPRAGQPSLSAREA